MITLQACARHNKKEDKSKGVKARQEADREILADAGESLPQPEEMRHNTNYIYGTRRQKEESELEARLRERLEKLPPVIQAAIKFRK